MQLRNWTKKIKNKKLKKKRKKKKFVKSDEVE